MRTGRSDGTTTYGYVYNGGQLTQMTVGSDTLTFGYDASGRPQTMTLGGETYYYVTNLQGDVTSITDSSGTWLVLYYYGGYGDTYATMNANEVARATPLVQLNPLVYRGYVYDRETRLFYLQSRYYNPRIGRFINADALVSTGQGLLGNNMFAYCLNNPVNACDPAGEAAIWLQDVDNAVVGKLGHTGLLIQDAEGTWYYFNWSDKSCYFAAIPLDEDGNSSLEKFMSSTGKRYEKSIYFEGDFSASIEYAMELKRNFASHGHNFFFQNCSQTSVEVLMQGEFSQSDFLYKLFLSEMRFILVPNVAYGEMFIFHSAIQDQSVVPELVNEALDSFGWG